MLDVQHFSKPEIDIRASRHAFFVRAIHSVPKEGHDYVTEHFYREYVLPKDIRPHEACCYITPQNIMVIEAPKLLLSEGNDSPRETLEFNDEEDEIVVPMIKIDSLEEIIPV